MRTIWNTQIHSVGRMQSFGMLKQVVRIVTTGLYGVNTSTKLTKIYTFLLELKIIDSNFQTFSNPLFFL
jgi:hypothetical protein